MYSKSSSLDAAFGVTKFITSNAMHLVTLGVNVIKLFSFITDAEVQYARGFALENPFQSGLRI
jgi:hypothetical protein